MRLWHYKLIPYLPKSQLLAQWRELNSIFKKQDKHILINYVYEYSKDDLFIYTNLVIKELFHRSVEIKDKSRLNCLNYFDYPPKKLHQLLDKSESIIFKNHHTYRYLLQCFYNLQEKYDRGQKDFTEENYKKLENFVFNC